MANMPGEGQAKKKKRSSASQGETMAWLQYDGNYQIPKEYRSRVM